MSGQALADGTVTSVTPDKTKLQLGQSLNANMDGSIVLGTFQKGCQMRVSIRYADNSVEVVNPGYLVNAFPVIGFYVKPTKLGHAHIIADGGGTNNLGWPICQGLATSADIDVTGLTDPSKTPVISVPQPVTPIVKPSYIPVNPGNPGPLRK
jgi:hypothetical protein